MALTAPTARLPGEAGMWLFILGDMLLYGLLFLIYAASYGDQPALFADSQAQLSQGFGVFNTLVLLTSSWFVAQGVRSARNLPGAPEPHWFLWAMGCGVAFGLSKVIEYAVKIDAGIVLTSNDFFMFYYMLTAFHLLHVMIGMVVLYFMWRLTRQPVDPVTGVRFLESGGVFWHLVGLLWSLIFPLLFLIGG